jgi:DNA-damage-inducible protein J
MKTAVINIKVDEKIKKEAQRLAKEMGLNLSAVINGFLNKFVREEKVEFSTQVQEKPSQYLIDAIKEAEEDVKDGRVSPTFKNAKEATVWLKKEMAK